MKFNQQECIGCGLCPPVCPVGAIEMESELAAVNEEQCVECHVCVRSDVCPTDSFSLSQPPWPRVLRTLFSDPLGKHESTQHLGRGTEEVKTNDVTNYVKPGQVGIAVEGGRPGVGASFADIELISTALASFNVTFAPKTPLTSLLADPGSGKLKPEILKERVLSAIVECTADIKEVPAILEKLQEVTSQCTSTVFSVGLFYQASPEHDPEQAWEKYGPQSQFTGKTNLGMGKATIKGG